MKNGTMKTVDRVFLSVKIFTLGDCSRWGSRAPVTAITPANYRGGTMKLLVLALIVTATVLLPTTSTVVLRWLYPQQTYILVPVQYVRPL